MLAGLAPDTFSGITVVDLSRLLPGPFCTQLLADLGARIVKVEAPEGGDYARWYPPLIDEGPAGYGAFFAGLNQGKESVAVDLKTPEGVELVRRLVQRADVLVEGFRPGVLDRLGLGRDVLRDANPQLVCVRISGFGQDGPLATRAGHDLGYLARSGLLSLQGPAGGPPAVLATQVADLAGGALYAAFALSAALFRRARTHQGADIDVSMCEGVLSLLRPAFAELSLGAPQPGAGQQMLTGGVPCYRCYATSDGRALAVAALEPHFWARACAVLGRPDLAGSGLESGERGAAVAAELAAVIGAQPLAHWQALFADVDACVEPVLTLDEVVADAHLAARAAFDARGLPRPPSSPPGARTGVPRLGADTRAVARWLGYGGDEIDALLRAGAIAAAPVDAD
jgi:alpha-methylacyl-CoA racemase